MLLLCAFVADDFLLYHSNRGINWYIFNSFLVKLSLLHHPNLNEYMHIMSLFSVTRLSFSRLKNREAPVSRPILQVDFKKFFYLLYWYRIKIISVHTHIISQYPIIFLLQIIVSLTMNVTMQMQWTVMGFWPRHHWIMHQRYINTIYRNLQKIINSCKQFHIVFFVMITFTQYFLAIQLSPLSSPGCVLFVVLSKEKHWSPDSSQQNL